MAAPQAVVAAQSSICRPEFRVGAAAYSAGASFLLAVDARRAFLVTAQHLFGPDGGLEAQVPWNDMPAKVRMTQCAATASGEQWFADPPLAIASAHPGVDDAMLDVAAFPFVGITSQPRLKLADRAPSVGESVWLVAEVIEKPFEPGLLHHATVAKTGDHAMYFLYDAPFSVRATSGAPIVNARGEVVGVNFGGGFSEDLGKMVGVATSWAALQGALTPKP